MKLLMTYDQRKGTYDNNYLSGLYQQSGGVRRGRPHYL